jgi:hypothetical protein
MPAFPMGVQLLMEAQSISSVRVTVAVKAVASPALTR